MAPPIGRRRFLSGTALALVPLTANFLARPAPLTEREGWERLADLPSARGEMKATAVGGRIYVPGGMAGPLGRSTERLAVYDPEADEWAVAAPMPTPLNHHAVTALEGMVYVTGGNRSFSDPPEDHAFRYDPDTDEWETLPALPEGRWGHECVAHEGRLYVVGGETSGGHEVLRFDGGDWQRLAAIPTPRDHLAAGVVDEEVLVAAGRWEGDNEDAVEAYDPATDEWRQLEASPTPRSGMAAGVLGGELHLAGGEDPSALTGWTTDRHERLSGEEWQLAPSIPLPLHGPATAVHEETMYVIGGAWRQGLFSPTSWSSRVFAYRP